MRTFRNALPALAVLSLAVAACKGPGSSVAPGGFPACNPCGVPHAQYVVESDVGNNSLITYNLGTAKIPNSGNLSPTYDVSGASTQLNTPWWIFNDSSSNLWAANQATSSVTWYSITTNGNKGPTNTISGANTTFGILGGITLSQNGTIYASDQTAQAIDVFAPGSHGNVAPAARIVGSNTTLGDPLQLALDKHGNIWIEDADSTNLGVPTIDEFAAPASGTNNVAPTAQITSSALVNPLTLYIDDQSHVWIGDIGGGATSPAILEFTMAAGSQTPLCDITGSNTTFSSFIGYELEVAVDNGGYIYEASSGAPAINVFLPGSCGNVAPSYTIAGSNTKMANPGDILVYSTGNDY